VDLLDEELTWLEVHGGVLKTETNTGRRFSLGYVPIDSPTVLPETDDKEETVTDEWVTIEKAAEILGGEPRSAKIRVRGLAKSGKIREQDGLFSVEDCHKVAAGGPPATSKKKKAKPKLKAEPTITPAPPSATVSSAAAAGRSAAPAPAQADLVDVLRESVASLVRLGAAGYPAEKALAAIGALVER
jgi:hypothetical protein